MKTNNELFVRGGQCTYEAPSLTALYLESEGLLCVSFGDANQAGKILEETSEWNF